MTNETSKGRPGRPTTGTVLFEGGRWKARVSLPNGQRKTIPLPAGYTEEQARAKAREIAEAVRTHGVEQGGPVSVPLTETVGRYVTRYVAWLEARELTSVDSMEGHLRNHVVPVIGDVEIRAVTREHIERVRDAIDAKIVAGTWVDAKGRNRRFQWKTGANVWGTVKALFDQAAHAKPASGLRVRDDDPTDRVLPPERGEAKDRQFLWPAEFDRLVACERVPMSWRRLYALSFYLGMRAGEIEALTWGCVDFVSSRVRVRQAMDRHRDRVKRPKSAAGRRPIPIEPTLLPLLLAMRQEAKDPTGEVDPAARVLPWMPAVSKLASSTRKHLEWAGVDRAELFGRDDLSLPIRFHDGRATYISWQTIRGDDAKKIQRRAGHSDGATTDIYIREVDGARDVGTPFGPLPTALLGGFRLAVSADGPPDTVEFSERETGLEPALFGSERVYSVACGGDNRPLTTIEDPSGVGSGGLSDAIAGHCAGRTWGDLDEGGAS